MSYKRIIRASEHVVNKYQCNACFKKFEIGEPTLQYKTARFNAKGECTFQKINDIYCAPNSETQSGMQINTECIARQNDIQSKPLNTVPKETKEYVPVFETKSSEPLNNTPIMSTKHATKVIGKRPMSLGNFMTRKLG